MQKKSTASFIIIVSLLLCTVSQAQVTEIWQKELNGNLIWQQVNSFGNYFICTNAELSSYDAQTGEKLWALNEFAGISEQQLTELSGSPLVSISTENDISLLDPYSGNIKFSSSGAGVLEIANQMVLYKANGILIAGKDTENKPVILMVDMATGKISWKIEEKFGKIVTINELSEQEILMVTLFKNYKVNSQTGEIIWKSSISKEVDQLEGMGAFGSFMKEVAAKAVEEEDFNVNFYKHPEKEIFIVGAENEEERQTSSVQTTMYSNNYSAFNISDGSRLWNNSLEMKGQLGDFTFYKDGFIVLPNDGARTRINFFDLNTATGKWGKKGRGIGIKGGVYNHVKTDQGILLISQSGDQNFLNFLNPDLGLITFEKPVKINGEVIHTIPSSKGILYITTREINILNPNTGELVFDKSISTTPSLFEQNDNQIYAYDLRDGNTKVIDINAGTVKNISKAGLNFEGKEGPGKLELRDNGIFISAEQNVALLSYDGDLVYQRYYEAPREPGLKRALLYAQAARAAYISANAYYAAGQLQSAASQVKEEDEFSGAIVEGFGMMYENLGDQASDFAKQSFQQANGRFKATAEGRDFMIILSKIEKDHALLKISKNTGEIDGSINLGSEKDPKYAVDDVTGQVFKKSGANQITSYAL